MEINGVYYDKGSKSFEVEVEAKIEIDAEDIMHHMDPADIIEEVGSANFLEAIVEADGALKTIESILTNNLINDQPALYELTRSVLNFLHAAVIDSANNDSRTTSSAAVRKAEQDLLRSLRRDLAEVFGTAAHEGVVTSYVIDVWHRDRHVLRTERIMSYRDAESTYYDLAERFTAIDDHRVVVTEIVECKKSTNFTEKA
jgi:hypothetical protein